MTLPPNVLANRRNEICKSLAKIEHASTYEVLSKAINNFIMEIHKVTIKELLKCKTGNELILGVRKRDEFQNEKLYLIRDSYHKDFFKAFIESQTFENFVRTLKENHIPENRRVYEFVISFRDNKQQAEKIMVGYNNHLICDILILNFSEANNK